MAVEPTPPVERILCRVIKQPDGCWVWQGATTGNGYGVIQLGRGIGTARTHRVMYEAHVGPIPEGLTIDHLCANILCCNPAHLDVVTRTENAKRQWAAGRADPGRSQREKTHCLRGHPFDEENTHLNKQGKRVCITCRRMHGREAARRRRASQSGRTGTSGAS